MQKSSEKKLKDIFIVKNTRNGKEIFRTPIRQEAIKICDQNPCNIIINREGEFVYTISADDILFDILSRDSFSMLSSENIKIDNVRKRRIFNTISVNNDIEDLISISLKQNYIPVVDDRNKFIGIITRQDIIKHFYSQLK
jgi:predicted transcriptional regulator